MPTDPTIAELDKLDDAALQALDWKNLGALNGRLLNLHAEGMLGNEGAAKLPRSPILCIDNIDVIDDDVIEASFEFPAQLNDWGFDPKLPLEMLFQDQLDQLVGFWGARKVDGIGRALSSSKCVLHRPIFYEAGSRVNYTLKKKKWMLNQQTGTGTAVFDGQITDGNGELILECKSLIVGILNPADVMALRTHQGGMLGVDDSKVHEPQHGLVIPLYDESTVSIEKDDAALASVVATQVIDVDLWPLKFHFRGDPVVPGNFGTHGMIDLVKHVAAREFGVSAAEFKSLATKKFSGMIFEDPKQIRFELLGVTQDESGAVVAGVANLYLETSAGERIVEDPIYTFKKITVA